MNILTTLLGGGDAIKAIGDTMDNLFTSDEERIEKKLESQKAQQAYDLEMSKIELQTVTAQADINKLEATNASVFVSGWRPFVGWVCAFALAYVSIIEPIVRFIAHVCFDYQGDFPKIDTTITLQVLLGMLGLGTMRSVDKYFKTDTKQVGN